MTSSQLAFRPGNVIQTAPQPGYWGCAVVLTAADGLGDSHPRFHVGITPIVLRHDYAWSELDPKSLSILEFTRQVRVASGEYGTRAELCIGIHTAVSRGDVCVIGEVDPVAVYPFPLAHSVGNGAAGEFPLCGPLTKDIGREAVIAWRHIHDAENFAREVEEARRQFEKIADKRAARQRKGLGTRRDA